MASQEHLELLKQGTAVWNEWRKRHPEIQPDLGDADLSDADLYGANLSRANLNDANLNDANLIKADLSGADLNNANLNNANLSGANLTEATLIDADLSDINLSYTNLSRAALSNANLSRAALSNANLGRANLSNAYLRNAYLDEADLNGADLSGADLSRVNLSRADLSNANLTDADLIKAELSDANLSNANLYRANLYRADLSNANLTDADLSRADLGFATFVRTNLKGTTLTGCRTYGISAWNVELTGALQDSLVITPPDEPIITVDNLKMAQFIYLLLNNQEIRDVIDTIAKKAVLILGRFTRERKAMLDALRDELRRHGYLPILFDFKKPSRRDLTETVSTLAHLSRFIVADLTDPSSIPQELSAIAPTLTVPLQPLLEASKSEDSMFSDLSHTYHWILPIYRYTDLDSLLASLQEQIINPAEQKAQELIKQKAQELTQQ